MIPFCLNCGCVGKMTKIREEGYSDYLDLIHSAIEEKRSSAICPSCRSTDMILCDEEIMNVVYKLNKLGYITHHSCSGHYQDGYRSMYIDFDEYYPDLEAWCQNSKFFYLSRFALYKTEDSILRFRSENSTSEVEYPSIDDYIGGGSIRYLRDACAMYLRSYIFEDEFPNLTFVNDDTENRKVNIFNELRSLCNFLEERRKE